MIIPFPDARQQQKDIATKFIKDARASFAGEKKTGYILITWAGDVVNVATYDTDGITYEQLEFYVDSALDAISDEME